MLFFFLVRHLTEPVSDDVKMCFFLPGLSVTPVQPQLCDVSSHTLFLKSLCLRPLSQNPASLFFLRPHQLWSVPGERLTNGEK